MIWCFIEIDIWLSGVWSGASVVEYWLALIKVTCIPFDKPFDGFNCDFVENFLWIIIDLYMSFL